jgi:beta-N-acetylhexosaminidase
MPNVAFAAEDAALREKIGRMVIAGFRGTSVEADSYIVKAVNDLDLGGVILFDIDVPSKSFPRNITSPSQTKKLLSDIKRLTRKDLIAAVDVEGGRVNRLKAKYGFQDFSGAQELGSINDPDETQRMGELVAIELKTAGFKLNFAPVVDLNINKTNPVIGGLDRSFSSDPDIVTDNAAAFIKGHRKFGVLTAIKHFPGHGSSAHDSHLGLADVTDTYNDMELVPYKRLIDSGYADIIMTSHVINRNIDPEHPATLSKKFIIGILRDELGFLGVVVSDDMQMGAIADHYGFEEACVMAVDAGCDMLIIGNNAQVYDESAPYRAVEAIFSAVRSGRIPISRIEESFTRIRRLPVI